MKVFISVISHGHEKLISALGCLIKLAEYSDFTIVLKNNKPIVDDDFIAEPKKQNINFIDEAYYLGFGENNNYIFNYAVEHLNLQEDDYFLVLNPDVYIDSNAVLDAVNFAQNNKAELITVNLYKDDKYQAYDNCVRKFPSLIDFISSYIGLGNKTIIDKSKIKKPIQTDWAAGSFLLFKASLYKKLGGFDPNYFMYCEDIDICWRAQKLFGQKLLFNPNIKAIHYAQHANRSLFSKHFLWHVKSMLRYLLTFYGFRKPHKSNLKENNNT